MRDTTATVPSRRMSVARGVLVGAGPLTADAMAAARVAAVQAAKRAWLDLPLSTPVQLTDATCHIEASDASCTVTVTVQAYARTALDAIGLAGASAALVSLWDSARAGGDGLSGARIELDVIQNVQD